MSRNLCTHKRHNPFYVRRGSPVRFNRGDMTDASKGICARLEGCQWFPLNGMAETLTGTEFHSFHWRVFTRILGRLADAHFLARTTFPRADWSEAPGELRMLPLRKVLVCVRKKSPTGLETTHIPRGGGRKKDRLHHELILTETRDISEKSV